MSEYDENLNNNPFLNELQVNHQNLIKKCAQEQWIICVPLKGSLKGRITLPLIFDQIINEKAQITLSKKPIKIHNEKIITNDDDCVKILFKEYYYVGNLKYIIWCLEQPLFSKDKNPIKIIELKNLHDCMNYLWGKYFADGRQIREFCQNFTPNLENLQNLKETFGILYSKCLQQTMKNSKSNNCKNINKLKLAVETFVQYSLNVKLIKAINTLTWREDAIFNKITRNYTNLPPNQLGIKQDIEDLLKDFNINNYNTILDKFQCFKRIFEFSNQINSDEILQILIYIIINVNVNNWISNFIYMSEFNLSSTRSPYEDYILSTFEAALEFIKGPKLKEIYINYIKSCSSNDEHNNQLIRATILNNIESVEYLLSTKIDFVECDQFGRNPLHYASMYGHQGILLILLNNGIDVHIQDNNGNTALHLAVNYGHENCVKTFIYTTNININKINKKGNTPLHIATHWGYMDIIKILIDNRANPWIKNKLRLTCLDLAPNYYILNILQQIPEFSKLGLKPRCHSEEKQLDLLLKAIKNNDLPLTLYYLGFATNNNLISTTTLKCHPLCDCEKCNIKELNCEPSEPNRQTVNIINKCNGNGFTPLHYASIYGCTDILRVLLDSRANPNLKTYNTLYTPLHLACLNKHLQIVKELVKCGGCIIDAQDYLGNTPLYYACFNNDFKMIEVLLINGADLGIKNFKGETILGMVQGKMFDDKTYKILKNYVK